MSLEPGFRMKNRANIMGPTFNNTSMNVPTQRRKNPTYKSPKNSPKTTNTTSPILREHNSNRTAVDAAKNRSTSPTPAGQKFTFQTLKDLTQRSRNNTKENSTSFQDMYARAVGQPSREKDKLSTTLKSMETNIKDQTKKETLEQYRITTENEQQVLKLRKELEEVKYRNLQLEGFYSKKAQFEELVRERDELREKNLDLLNSAIAFENLGSQISELENSSEKIRNQNQDLKLAIADYEKEPVAESEYISASAKRLQLLRKELSQLVQLVSSLRKGDDINLGLLLGGMYTYDESASMTHELELFNTGLHDLRNLASDIYGEVCGSKCHIQ